MLNVRRAMALAGVVVLAASQLTACNGSSGNGGSNSNEILVGEFGSMTGSTATFGQSTHSGVMMAVEELNAAGGVLGKKVKILLEDDQSKPEEAATAVTKLVTQDKVVAVLGEVASSRTMAAAPVAQQNKVPLISPSSTNPKVTQLGDFIFRVCFIDPFQGAVMAKFAANDLQLKKVAVLYDVRNDYSVGLRNFFSETYKSLGGQIVGEQSYSEGDSDFRAQLTQLKSLSPEAIYVPGYYTEVGTIARQAKELGLNVPLMGGDGWDSPKLIEIGGEAMEGHYLSNHNSMDDPNPLIQKFSANYKQKYGAAPDALAALGYDAANVLFDAMKRAGTTDGTKVRDAIAATKDFPGVTGSITIDKERNAVKPAVVLKIVNGKQTFVKSIGP
jgi:branched-chain amino acid transport system substrate-binding protein